MFVKNLPENTTEEELKSLSPDIENVRIKKSHGKLNKKNEKKGKQFVFAFLEFASEELANKNYKELQHKKIRDKEFVVDFIGEKSAYVKKESEKKDNKPKEKDLKRLHIGGFDKSATEADLKKLYSGFTEFSMPIKKDTKLNMGFAFVAFSNEQDAKKALDATNGKDFNGRKLNVDYAFQRDPKVEKKKEVAKKEKAAAAAEQPANKKVKNEQGQAKAATAVAAVAATAAVAKAGKNAPAAVAPVAAKVAANGKDAKKQDTKQVNGKRKLEEEEEDESDEDEDDDEDEDEDDDDEDDDEEDEDDDDEEDDDDDDDDDEDSDDE